MAIHNGPINRFICTDQSYTRLYMELGMDADVRYMASNVITDKDKNLRK